MYSVLLVDDEYLIRQLIRSSIRWEELGFTIIGEAANAQEALEEMVCHHPDLVLLDINLPAVSGLELCKTIRERFPNTLVIMLTGYDRFEYARESLRQGVFDYLVKPLDEKELTATLSNVVKELNRRAQKHRDKIPEGTLGREDFLEKAKEYIRLSKMPVVCCAVEISRLQYRWKSRTEQLKWLGILSNTCEDFFKGNFEFFSSCVEYPFLLIYVSTGNLPRDSFLSFLNQMCQKVLQSIGLTISIGVGLPTTQALYETTEEPIRALDSKFLSSTDSIYPIETSLTVYPTAPEKLGEPSDLLYLLRKKDFQTIQETISNILKRAKENRFCKDYIHLLAASIVNQAICFCVETGLNMQGILASRDDCLMHIQSCETIGELECMLHGLYRSVLELSDQQDSSKTQKLVELTVNYIEHYFYLDTLTLGSIADALFINANYLSKIFKQQMNISVSEYMIHYRLQTAKTLMESNKNLRIIDVARQVGYSDPFYFSKSFKKQFGVSPSKFLERVPDS